MRSPSFWLVLALSSCAGGESIDPPGTVSDTGTVEETSGEDSGVGDTGNEDTGLADSGGETSESGTADTSVADTSVADTSVADTSVADTSVADTSVADTSVADTGPPDSGFKSTDHVHIYIDNFCKVTTSPTSFTVPAGETLQLSYHNHSVDYLADVWMMYGGGYLELAKGGTWNETYKHCFGPAPSTGYADISIAGGGSSACPKVRLYIYCK